MRQTASFLSYGTLQIIDCFRGTCQLGITAMGPGYFVIAILGCADGSAACTPVATVPTQFYSEAACSAATAQALIRNSDFDFPTIVAECRAVVRPASASSEEVRPVAGAIHG